MIHTSEHNNGIFWKLELVDEEVLHAFGVIDATLELMPRVLVRYPADHRLLPAVHVRRRTRRRVVVGRGRRGRVVAVRSGRWGLVGGGS